MTATHERTNGTGITTDAAWLAEKARAIDPEQRERFERYLGEILSSLGMDLHTPGTAGTPRRFLQALINVALPGHGAREGQRITG